MTPRAGPHALRFVAFLVLALSAVSGCMKLGPDFARPEMSMPRDWLEGHLAATRPDSPPPDQWWGQLGDPALNAIVAKALEGNLNLRVAGARVLAARAQLGVAAGNIYPQTQQAQGAYQYYQVSKTAPASPQVGQSLAQYGYWQNNFNLYATWELDFWGKYRRGVEAAEAGLAQNMAEYDNSLVMLLSDTAQAYVYLRTMEERLRIAASNVELQREGLKIASARYRLGATSDRDVEQATTLLQSTLATIPTLNNQIANHSHALCVLMGDFPRDISELLGPDSRIPEPPAVAAAGVPIDLLRRRPDLRKAEMAAWAQCAKIGVAKADLFPSFYLTGNIGYLSSNVLRFNLDQVFTPATLAAQAGPSFSWNILNYGRLVDNVRAQDAMFQAALETYGQTALTAVKEAEDAMSAFYRGRERVAELIKAAAAAKMTAKLAFIEYSEGKTDYTTVLVAQQNELIQEDSLAQARGDVAIAFVSLYKAVGGGWEVAQGKKLLPDQTLRLMSKRTWWGGLLGEDTQTYEKTPDQRGIGVYIPDY